MKIDKKIVKASGRAGIVGGLVWTISLFAFAWLIGSSHFISPRVQDPESQIMVLFGTLLGAMIYSGVYGVLFGAIYHYIPTKKLFTKYAILGFIIGFPFALTSIWFKLPDIVVGTREKIVYYTLTYLLDIIMFVYLYKYFNRIKEAAKIEKIASMKRRTAAFAIDILILTVFSFIFLAAASIPNAGLIVGEQPNLELFNSKLRLPAFIMLACWSLYWPICEFLLKKTMGKAVLGIEVVKEDGRRIGLKESITRNLSKMTAPLMLIALVIDIIPALKTKTKQKIFDLIAGTIVIKTKSN